MRVWPTVSAGPSCLGSVVCVVFKRLIFTVVIVLRLCGGVSLVGLFWCVVCGVAGGGCGVFVVVVRVGGGLVCGGVVGVGVVCGGCLVLVGLVGRVSGARGVAVQVARWCVDSDWVACACVHGPSTITSHFSR